MKKILFFVLIFSVPMCAQIVNISDSNFKAQLLQSSASNTIALGSNDANLAIDSNGDGQIQDSEALAVYSLSISNNTIVDFTGIKSFTNLKSLKILPCQAAVLDISGLVNIKDLSIEMLQLSSLNCSGVNAKNLVILKTLLTALDLRQMTNLEYLECKKNSLMKDLNISGLANLQETDLTATPIENYDSSNAISLRRIDSSMLSTVVNLKISGMTFSEIGGNITMGISSPNLKTVYASNCHGLTYLSTNSIFLETFDITNCTDLTDLTIVGGQLTSLNLTGVINLEDVSINSTQITSLDFSNQPRLNYLACGRNPLTFINLKNGTSLLSYFEVINTPLLSYICADEGEIPFIIQNSESHTMVGSDCSFTPGGTYNTISGKLRFDANGNGCDNSDNTYSFAKIKLSTTSGEREVFTNASGDYSFFTVAGTYTLEASVENPQYFTSTPQSNTVIFPTANSLTEIQDFCITANGLHPDAEIAIAPMFAAIPGFECAYKIAFKNKGNQILNGNINFIFDDGLVDFVSASQIPVQSSGNLDFNYADLMPFESREITLRMRIHAPTEIPGVHINDILHFNATINPLAPDDLPLDNSFALNQLVTAAYDPNNKICLEGETLSPENIGKYLHYNINFENTGNADAMNIIVRDTINIQKFDISSLQVLNSSHPVKITIKENVVEFIFENINLPSSIRNPIGGHGNVLFKVRTNPNLSAGDTVENTANIYFDYNAPIVTNEAKTTFRLLSDEQFERDKSVKIHPNPTKDFVKIQSKNMIKSVDLFDAQDRILQTAVENKKETHIDLSQQSNGIYFLKISTEKGSKIEKIIKK